MRWNFGKIRTLAGPIRRATVRNSSIQRDGRDDFVSSTTTANMAGAAKAVARKLPNFKLGQKQVFLYVSSHRYPSALTDRVQ